MGVYRDVNILYKTLGIISLYDMDNSSDCIPNRKIRAVATYDNERMAGVDYTYDWSNITTTGFLCDISSLKDFYTGGHKRNIGYVEDEGMYCDYVCIEKTFKSVKVSAAEYISLHCAMQVLNDSPKVLEALDENAQKYGTDSELVKEIWQNFWGNEQAASDRLHQKMKEMVSATDIYYNPDYPFPSLDAILKTVLHRNEECYKVEEQKLYSQIYTRVRTKEEQEKIDEARWKRENAEWWDKHGGTVITWGIAIIMNIICFAIMWIAGENPWYWNFDEDNVVLICIFLPMVLGALWSFSIFIKDGDSFFENGIFIGLLYMFVMFAFCSAICGSLGAYIGHIMYIE